MERKGIIAAGNMLVDHVHQIGQWPERGWLVEIVHSERATGGAPLNVLLTLAKMHAGLPLQAVGLIGEDTFFHSPGANRLLDLPAFEPLDAPLKIFHLGYLLLLESLDRPDEVYGTRSARLLAQMRERGYEVSLDLVSRKGDPRYRPLVLPALKHLDYLTINELEASEFSGLEIRLPNGEPHVANIARAASALLDAGVRQRVVIHCPEGAWGVSRTEAGRWVPSWRLPPEEIIGSVGAGDAFCAGLLYGSHERWPLTASLQLAHACARASLQAANAIDGAKTLPELQAFIQLQNV